MLRGGKTCVVIIVKVFNLLGIVLYTLKTKVCQLGQIGVLYTLYFLECID